MMAMPPLMILPGITSILALSWWVWLPAFAVIIACEIGAACAFFPLQTVHRYKRWRQHNHALRTGDLYPEDVERLLARHTPSKKPASGVCVADVTARLVRLAPTRAWESHANGKVVVQWIRQRGDLALLADALKVGLPAAALLSHLSGAQPLNADALRTVAALRDEPDLPHDADFVRAATMKALLTGTPTTAAAAPSPTAGASHCPCPFAHT